MKLHPLAALVSGLLLCLLLTAGGWDNGRGSPPTMPGKPSSTSGSMMDNLRNLDGKDFAVKFMRMMILHHRAAIAMADLVPARTTRAELQSLARNIIASQGKESSDMTSWLSQWYQEKPQMNMMDAPGMAEMMKMMAQMKQERGAGFDADFLRVMMMHHLIAVHMAALVSQKMQQRPELVQLARNIMMSQGAEMQKMCAWKNSWFKD